jgi:hypothetical protein
MRENRSSGSVEGVMSNRDPYSDYGQNNEGRDVPPSREVLTFAIV